MEACKRRKMECNSDQDGRDSVVVTCRATNSGTKEIHCKRMGNVKIVDCSPERNTRNLIADDQIIINNSKLATKDSNCSRLHPILSDELLDNVPLTEVYTTNVLKPRHISSVVIELNLHAPIPELSHLKRINRRAVLLFPKHVCGTDEVYDHLRSLGYDPAHLDGTVEVANVASIPPKVRSQYDIVNKLWPCNFHENKYLEKLVCNGLFNAEEILQHEEYMRIALDVAKLRKNSKTVGAVVVDPKLGSVVSVGYNESDENPCKHACMVAVDNVAVSQGGGTWRWKPETVTDDGLNTGGIPRNVLVALRAKYTNVKFGATPFKTKETLENPEDGPYLCTGYYVYVTHEPCIMCAMALVHSRMKRVFYGVKVKEGGLGSTCKIHTINNLNHHFEVFAGLLEEECSKLQNNISGIES